MRCSTIDAPRQSVVKSLDRPAASDDQCADELGESLRLCGGEVLGQGEPDRDAGAQWEGVRRQSCRFHLHWRAGCGGLALWWFGVPRGVLVGPALEHVQCLTEVVLVGVDRV